MNTFQYHKKTFKCGDVLVKDYYLFIKNPDETCKRLLLEFNDKVPNMTKEQRDKFIAILLLSETNKKTDDSDKKTPVDLKKALKKIEIFEKEFHVMVGFVAKSRGFSRGDIMDMPYFVFKRYYEDIPIISGQKEYDPKRSDITMDKKSINDALGNKKILKAN